MMLKALVVFALTYCLMIALPRFRPLTACAGALAFLLLKLIPPDRALASIQWNVLLMIGGTMGVVSLFSATGMPARMADRITRLVPDVRWAILALSLLASLVSALVDNVATVLMIAPVAIAVAEKQRINPVPMLIAIAVSSNLQGAATLVGDTTSILMGSEAGMDFLDFFDFISNSVMMPIAAIATCVLILRSVTLNRIEEEIKISSEFKRQKIYNLFIKYFCIAFLAIILISSVLNVFGIIKM